MLLSCIEILRCCLALLSWLDVLVGCLALLSCVAVLHCRLTLWFVVLIWYRRCSSLDLLIEMFLHVVKCELSLRSCILTLRCCLRLWYNIAVLCCCICCMSLLYNVAMLICRLMMLLRTNMLSSLLGILYVLRLGLVMSIVILRCCLAFMFMSSAAASCCHVSLQSRVALWRCVALSSPNCVRIRTLPTLSHHNSRGCCLIQNVLGRIQNINIAKCQAWAWATMVPYVLQPLRWRLSP